ncbi:hypothetical protein GQ53DRAFT_798456 [Thozetella sp. PMI_491]|nr:hypothetical protein GQ53DRAFT_798456 [Thozetella sp. PMI_491]
MRNVIVKVKTGCTTCRARKIKCDETKPSCNQCTRAGKKCAYAHVPQARSTRSWADLIGAQSVIPAPAIHRSGREGRALEFFQHIVAPTFSTYPDPGFWGRVVQAAVHQEPAVRHAVLAISSLYEGLVAEQFGAYGSTFYRINPNQFALVQYNRSLSHLAAQSSDSTVVLLTCLLFVCIESLRANRTGMTEHTRHGINILNNVNVSSWVREHLAPLFVRQSIYGFFTLDDAADFPLVALPPDARPPYTTFSQCMAVVDSLTARVYRLARLADNYRIGDLSDMEFPAELRLEHYYLSSAVEQWLLDFTEFEEMHPPVSDQDKSHYAYCRFKGLSSKTMIAPVLGKTEMGYDDEIPVFKEMVDLAELVASLQNPGDRPTSRFSFDVGYLPMLCEVASKCRDLTIRLAAIRAMRNLAIKNDGLFQFVGLNAFARRIVELEHVINLAAYENGEYPGAEERRPPDEARVYRVLPTEEKRVGTCAYQNRNHSVVSTLYSEMQPRVALLLGVATIGLNIDVSTSVNQDLDHCCSRLSGSQCERGELFSVSGF